VSLARKQPNITVRSDRIDLRYIVGQARLLVTSRATSTVYWCLASGRPVAFIDHPDELPLTPDAHKAFAESLFLFDARQSDWKDRLRTFLSRPLAEIEQDWKDRAGVRASMMRTYFNIHPGGAGRRAARHILETIRTGIQFPEQ
jgi:hypothetical protein